MAKREKTYSELQGEIERLVKEQKELKQRKAEVFANEIMKTDLGKILIDKTDAEVRSLAKSLSINYTRKSEV